MLSCLLLHIQIAHDAAMAYMNSKEPQYRTIADVIIMALAKSKTINHGKFQGLCTSDILHYINSVIILYTLKDKHSNSFSNLAQGGQIHGIKY